MRSPLIRLLFYSGIPSLLRRLNARKARFVIMLHGVSAEKHQHIPLGIQPYLSAVELSSVLSWIGARFQFLTPEEFLKTLKPGVLITFDDGFENNYKNALPVLESLQVPAIYFVTVQHILDPHNWLTATRHTALKYWRKETEIEQAIAHDFFDGMDSQHLLQCAQHALITIGSHTLSHPFLTQCDPQTLALELSESKRILESLIGNTVDLFAYPTGDYDRTVIQAVKRAGYRAGFVMDSKKNGFPDYEIPRIGLYESNPIYLELKLSGLHRAPIVLNKPYKGRSAK